jgi:hypothetical protein
MALYECRQFVPVSDTQFSIDVVNMIFNGPHRYPQTSSDGGIASALEEQVNDFPLPLRNIVSFEKGSEIERFIGFNWVFPVIRFEKSDHVCQRRQNPGKIENDQKGRTGYAYEVGQGMRRENRCGGEYQKEYGGHSPEAPTLICVRYAMKIMEEGDGDAEVKEDSEDGSMPDDCSDGRRLTGEEIPFGVENGQGEKDGPDYTVPDRE